jgi:hypothetical protein
MPLLALWVVAAPFAAGAAIASSETLRKAVATHYVAALTLGWSALLFLVGSVMVVHGMPAAATLIAAPLAGLAFWRCVNGRDDFGGEPDDPEPDLGDIDWDDFLRNVNEWARRPLVHR